MVVPDVAADLVDAILCVRSRLIGRSHAHRSDVFGLNYVRRCQRISPPANDPNPDPNLLT